MKTKNLEDYYNKYVYYYYKYHGITSESKSFIDLDKSNKDLWILNYQNNNGVIPEWLVEEVTKKLDIPPTKPRTVINPRKATA